ncbi:MAG: S9 family peptidase [Chitinophagaceae bacterium]|nr:S9 family peptidase [Chitinophagaceae bacterium]
MNRIIILIAAFILTQSLSAQKKNFTMAEAVNGMGTTFKLKSLSQLQWMGSAEYYSYVVSNDTEKVIMAYSPETFDAETVTSLEKMNKQLKGIGVSELKAFPAIHWITQTKFYINHEHKYIFFNTTARDSTQVSIQNEEPATAENVFFDSGTMRLAYTDQYNLFVKLPGASSEKITSDGSKDMLYGTSVHRDEFGIDHGIFWSPRGNHLAFYRMDQSMVEDYPVVDWSAAPATVKFIKYPFAGRKSHHVTLGVYNIGTKSTVYLKTGEPADQYLTTVTWSPDEKYIYVSVLNRDQNHLWMNQYDASTGELIKTLFEETSDRYVEPQHQLYFIGDDASQFIWWSQRDGYMHLYLYKQDGTLLKQLTKGPWIVNEILGYNKKSQEIIFTGTMDSPLQKNVYAVQVSTNKMRSLSGTKASHTAQLSADGNYLIDQYTSMSVPKNIEITNVLTGAEKRILTAGNTLENYQTAQVRSVQLYASDSTLLYGKLILPYDFDSTKKYPVVVYLYNGPHLQLNRDAFPASGNLWYDYMTQHGYVMFVMDGRGSSNRGFAFESAVHRQLGTLEMEDQLKGVDYLKSLPYVDSTHMGVHGWSFGGFMTTSLMLRHPGVFTCGVAGGPVLDWSMYEVMYTERYMDTPEQNPEGYKANKLLDKVKGLKSKLLMIHGTDDDVVVWQHSIMMQKKSVDEGVQLDYYVYPGHPHNVRGKDRVHLMQKITDYFDMHLK